MNNNSKTIVMVCTKDVYKLNNSIRKNGIESALKSFLEEMPKNFKKSTEHYEINAYVDCKKDFLAAESGWDLIGGPDVDRYIINGRECHTTWNGKPQMEKVGHPDFYKKYYKYNTSIENNHVKNQSLHEIGIEKRTPSP